MAYVSKKYWTDPYLTGANSEADVWAKGGFECAVPFLQL
ncbi:hypothetical protein CCACVL1_19090 [Corchorus capsularis]|uniref:Uncharacterized protein n=1 Tax=Corchorus capsularis TaxID=210143 RepID=A0A1R3HIG3_COCAP|nr:hypothetical protein CCACVL1_19090 [Corchorus capsularis]